MNDIAHMQHALALGRRGVGQTWPNPSVGCVIVDAKGHVVGRGFTQTGGRPHAETMALAQAGDAARGATAYVTLEPCAHHGKTPPCADALVAAGVTRVVGAITDPDPRVSGRGYARLRAANITVDEGICAQDATTLNAGFLKRVTENLPMVTLKMASTIDGRIATHSGESRWITGPQARRYVHLLRMTHDAVMIGSGTALADDPDLRAREMGATRQPVRIVLDSALRLPQTSRLAQSAHETPLWILHDTCDSAWQNHAAKLIKTPKHDIKSALHALAQHGITRVLCEGGGTLGAALIGAGLVDQLIQITAGKVIGAQGLAAISALPVSTLADIPSLHLHSTQTLGPDTATIWQRGK